MDDKIAPVILAVMLVIGAPVFAQQASEAAKPAAAPADTAAEDAEAAAAIAAIEKAKAAAAKAAGGKSDAGRDTDIAKQAKQFGWHPEVKRGVTMYCREAPVIGSRFTQKRCATESQLAAYLEQQQNERDQLSQRGCGGNCGGK
jgi:hypothetical protein